MDCGFSANRGGSVLSLINFRMIEVNQDFNSDEQEVRKEGGVVEFGLLER